ncbi:MAG: hypothetical protein A3J29_00130 [Acidobacteria bacterium RIFCSPLOWO2_12_FULL_67_14b]|nr:MAG: hypothetical protein A3J29_00130 [Acidobacteria bacterium RIFCSPLOWO2_12_FULL_67_14b]
MFSRAERALVAKLNTPGRVQRWLNALPYNTENGGPTQRSFRTVAKLKTAHCMEAALFAAVVLEQHGYPPLVMSLESQDWLDHVIFIYQHDGRWGSVARSRDPGLHGRKPVFRSPRALARSYIDAYVDHTGRVEGFGVANLAEAMGAYDWRVSGKNVWKVERMLIDLPHKKLKSSIRRYRVLLRRYRAYRKANNDRKPVYYRGRNKWTPIPSVFGR